ncbi:MAG TPA: amidohydrolase family protein, partial [Bryobacteraceae bacterium]|nr:amidohydrolase family protein [Bryobacteraceae bacterium]
MLALAVLVLNHVAVIDVAGGTVKANRAVAIEAGTISSVAPAHSYHVPEGARVLDLPGRYLAPGLIDMHAHVLFPPLGPDGRPLPSFDRDTALQMLRTLLAYGITTVRDTGDATEAAVTMRRLIASGKVIGPDMLTAGRILTKSPLPHAIYAPVASVEEVRKEVDWQAKVGVDFIKVYADMPPSFVRAAIDEARRYGVPVIGHLQATTWTEAARMGISAICHASPWAREYLPAEAQAAYQETMWGRVYWLEHVDLRSQTILEMMDALVRNHVPVDPTLMAFRTKFWGDDPYYTASPHRSLAPPKLWAGWPQRSNTADWTAAQYREARAQWPKLLALVKALFDHGVLLTAGTDTPFPWIIPGISLHEELQLLSHAGLPTPAVLRTATVNAARALRREK